MADVPQRGYTIEELQVGMTASYERLVTTADIEAFAAVSGDHNPVHLDEEYAKTTRFKGRIAHGILGASFISTAIASRLPGPGSIYLSQNLVFKRPVRPGETIEARITVTAVDIAKSHATLKTQCFVAGTVVIDGEATVLAPHRS